LPLIDREGDMSRVTRRESLKLIAAAGTAVGVAAGCKTKGTSTMTTNGKGSEQAAGDAVLSLTPLGFPWRTHDPFLFCVHHDDHYPAGNPQFGPATSLAGRNMGQDFEGIDGWRMYHGEIVPGFPQHPHRGFETVTVVRRGLLDHSDSLGAAARYGEGDVQWLTAGGGILHSEMFPLLSQDRPNPLELFQIWLNLPAAKKMVEPHFAMLWSPSIPRRLFKDDRGAATEVALVAGRLDGVAPPAPPPNSWAAVADADVAIWTIKMAPGARWTLPPAAPGSKRSLYFFKGSALSAGGLAIPPAHEAELRDDRALVLEAGASEVEVLLLQGRPIGEPVVQYGPFVMNTRDEIRQAFADYQRTQFGGWPWPSHEPVHGGAPDRFARRPDGKTERPG
jgi:redox-sensitive bicupin YhaK (pirin superfamily)